MTRPRAGASTSPLGARDACGVRPVGGATIAWSADLDKGWVGYLDPGGDMDWHEFVRGPGGVPEEYAGVHKAQDALLDRIITLHLDHPFWESLEEDAPLRFDLIAAQKSVAAGMTAPASASVTAEELASVGFVAGKDAQSNDLPWRYCGDVAAGERTTGNVSYNPNGVAVSAAGGAAGLKGFADYMSFNLSTFGHLNNDGLCFPSRNFAAPAQP